MQERCEAFIAANKYLQKETLPFGVGVVASFNEENAKRDSIRLQHLDTQNEWYLIALPDRSSFLQLDSAPTVNEKTMPLLFSPDAMRLLFTDEARLFFKGLDAYIQSNDISDKETVAKEEIAQFYKEKADFLKSQPSAQAMIDFITSKARNNDIAITSSFLAHFGVPGVIYSENNEERLLIFDAKHSISILRVHSQQTANSLFAQ